MGELRDVDRELIDRLLADAYPGPGDGSPTTIAERLREADVQAAILALPPLTRLPLTPWPLAGAVDAARDSVDVAALAGLFRASGALDRAHLVARVGEVLGADGTAAFVERAPDEPVALLVHAAGLQATAWELRGPRAEDDPDADEFGELTFRSNLAWAHELCERAAAQLPGDPTPWVVAQRSSAAGDLDDRLRAAERWQRLDRWHYFGNLALLPLLGWRWGGTAALQLEHATALHAAAPAGSPAHTLVTDALCEAFAERAFGAEPDPDPDVVFTGGAELIAAAHRASIGHPAWRRGWLDGAVRNSFAFCAYYANLDALAWHELQALGGHVMDLPWRLKGGDALEAYQLAREWLVRHVAQP